MRFFAPDGPRQELALAHDHKTATMGSSLAAMPQEDKMAIRENIEVTGQLWTVHDVARFLQMSASWVYKQAEAGLLPTRRLGAALRFDQADIRAYARGDWKPASAALLLQKQLKRVK